MREFNLTAFTCSTKFFLRGQHGRSDRRAAMPMRTTPLLKCALTRTDAACTDRKKLDLG
jgi:hypothetical protein